MARVTFQLNGNSSSVTSVDGSKRNASVLLTELFRTPHGEVFRLPGQVRVKVTGAGRFIASGPKHNGKLVERIELKIFGSGQIVVNGQTFNLTPNGRKIHLYQVIKAHGWQFKPRAVPKKYREEEAA